MAMQALHQTSFQQRWALSLLFSGSSKVSLSKCGIPESQRRRFSQALLASELKETSLDSEEVSGNAAEIAAAPLVDKENKPAEKVLLGKSVKELEDLCEELGEKRFRGRQMHNLIYKVYKADIQDLSQLSKSFREKLMAEGWKLGRSRIHHQVKSKDGTVKVLLRLEDNRLVETVGIPSEYDDSDRLTVCVSSQVGCALKCAFCATGKGGYTRNLKPHEIIEQVLVMEEIFKRRVRNVVFMGMGEPMMNLKSVLAAHRCINEEIGIGQRMMTISTVGVPNTIRRLADHKLQSTLAVSLHAPNQRLREQLVPSAKSYPLEALLQDCKDYFELTGRRVTFEYTLIAGINDQEEQALQLGDLLRRWKLGSHVNLIPYNPIADSEFNRPFRRQVESFVEALAECQVNASVRQTRGVDANAACGQLRNEFQKVPLVDLADNASGDCDKLSEELQNASLDELEQLKGI